MTAFVAGDFNVVDPNGRAVVDRPETQAQVFAFWRIEPTPVPDHIAGELTDPGELRFGAEGDHDAAIEGGRLPRAEFPFAVQVQPFRPSKCWPRVLRPGNLLWHLAAHLQLGERSLLKRP